MYNQHCMFRKKIDDSKKNKIDNVTAVPEQKFYLLCYVILWNIYLL